MKKIHAIFPTVACFFLDSRCISSTELLSLQIATIHWRSFDVHECIRSVRGKCKRRFAVPLSLSHQPHWKVEWTRHCACQTANCINMPSSRYDDQSINRYDDR